jgi:hypothetical protein
MSHWIACADQMPLPGVGVLITDGHLITVGALSPIGPRWWVGHGFSGWEWEYDFRPEAVTHWQPLPPLPGQEKEAS